MSSSAAQRLIGLLMVPWVEAEQPASSVSRSVRPAASAQLSDGCRGLLCGEVTPPGVAFRRVAQLAASRRSGSGDSRDDAITCSNVPRRPRLTSVGDKPAAAVARRVILLALTSPDSERAHISVRQRTPMAAEGKPSCPHRVKSRSLP